MLGGSTKRMYTMDVHKVMFVLDKHVPIASKVRFWAYIFGTYVLGLRLGTTSWDYVLGLRLGTYVLGPTSWDLRLGTYVLGPTSWDLRLGTYVLGPTSWGYVLGLRLGAIVFGTIVIGDLRLLYIILVLTLLIGVNDYKGEKPKYLCSLCGINKRSDHHHNFNKVGTNTCKVCFKKQTGTGTKSILNVSQPLTIANIKSLPHK